MRSQVEEAEQSPIQSIHVFGFTFPDCQHLPAEPPEPPHAQSIPFDIPTQFRRPISDSRFGSPPILAGSVLMPKTTVNEDDLSPSRKYQIRRPRQASLMKRVTVSEAMQKSAHNEFRLRVLASNPAHDFTAACWRDSIHRLGLQVSRYNLAIGSPGSTTKWPSARNQERR
jgi:hypothetical protein